MDGSWEVPDDAASVVPGHQSWQVAHMGVSKHQGPDIDPE